jgi:glycerol dehydrogenase
MDNYTMLMPNYSIGAEVYSKIGEYCTEYGKKAVIIGGKTALSKAEPLIINAVNSLEFTGTLWYGGNQAMKMLKSLWVLLR